MIHVIVHKNPEQRCWYINRKTESGLVTGKVCYGSRSQALSVARQQNPYARIEVEE